MVPRTLFLVAALLLGPRLLLAATLEVAQDGTGAHLTLRAAIEAAQVGDTILVHPGVYDETSDPELAEIDVESVTIRGVGALPSDAAITGVHLWFHAAGSHTVENLRFFGESRLLSGSPPSSFTMRDVIISDRVDPRWCSTVGAGGTVLISNCTFENLTFTYEACNQGQAINLSGASGGALIEGCVFSNVRTTGTGAAVAVVENTVLRNCVFANNVGGWAGAVTTAVSCCGYPNAAVIESCTFWRNECLNPGAAVYLTASYVKINHSIFAETINGKGISTPGGGQILCNDFWMNELGTVSCPWCFEDGNFEADPLFCDAVGGDFRIDPASPCQPGGHGGYPCGLVGAFGDCAPSTVEGTVGEPGTGSPLVVLRNPVAGTAALLLTTSTPGTVSGSVHATDGRRVLEVAARPVGAGEARIEMTLPTELPGGTYYVKLQTPDGVRTARVVLLR